MHFRPLHRPIRTPAKKEHVCLGAGNKLENHACAVSLHFMYYNFARVHQTLDTTPAVAAGVADHVWSIEEIVGLLDSN